MTGGLHLLSDVNLQNLVDFILVVGRKMLVCRQRLSSVAVANFSDFFANYF